MPLLKIPLQKRWFQAVPAFLIFTAGARAGYGQITNWVGIFNSSADTAQWSHVSANPNTISFLAGDAPAGGPSTGCMVLQSAFGPGTNNDWTAIGKNVHDLNVSNCTALELDVKADPGCGFDTYGHSCAALETAIEYGSTYTWVTTAGVAVEAVAANNGWQHVVVPAGQLRGSTNWGDLKEVIIDPWDGYYPTAVSLVLGIANVKFTSPAPVPVSPTISVDARSAVRTADARWFGINTGDWDTDFNIQDTVPELNKAGWQTLRFPGGADADNYHWYLNTDNNHASYQQNNSGTNFAAVAANMGATVIITANYGTGTPAEAAAWVACSNVTNHYGFKYWEIGNEEYFTREPYAYATNVAAYAQQMKAVDPSIKIGVVVVKGLQAASNGYTNHPATNLVTGAVVYGWTPVVLSTLYQLGVTPDFAIYHWYPEDWPYAADDDQTLLAGTGNWAGDAAELRADIAGFFGPGGTNIELLVTENNSDAGTPGKQSVSLVNGLYYADGLGQLMKTEFNALVWWHLRDGEPPYTSGDLSSSLYGWRQYGSFGVMAYGNGQQTGIQMTNRYPPYFAAELVSRFVRGGDTVVGASCNNPLVSAYAALRTNGSLTLMAINKSSTSNYTANIVLTNYVPGGTATVYSYGMPQDNTAQAADNACDIATNYFYGVSLNFSYTLAPYSITVFAFASAPSLSVLSPSAAGQIVLQLAGQPGVPYVLQTSTDLSGWTSVATNTLTGNVLDITNTLTSGGQFWRAAWFP